MLTAEQFAERLINELGRPFRLRITGFPACGKSTLSSLLRRRIPNLKHIESEAWIHSLNYRKKLDLSGAHPEGYERERSVKELHSFLRGTDLLVQRYDHHLGARVDGVVITSERAMPVILDGTLFSLSDYDHLVPPCIFIRPRSLEEWLKVSIRRDVETRSFSEAEATRHNMRKVRDIEDVLRSNPNADVVTCDMSSSTYYYEIRSCEKI